MLLGIRRIVDRFILLLVVAVVLTGCADDVRIVSPPTEVRDDHSEPMSSRSPFASVTCTANIDSGELRCGEVAVADGTSGPQRVMLGGQGLYVDLLSPAEFVSYDPVNERFAAVVQVRNRIGQGLGSPDGLTISGVRVFFHEGPVATVGEGTVSVIDPDGFGTFTGADQPYYLYDLYLPPGVTSSGKLWQWDVPQSVTSFEFSVFVDADVVGESGYVEMAPTSQLLAAGGTFSVTGTPRDVVGRAVTGTVTYSSSDPSVATVDPISGLVTAVGTGAVDIIGESSGDEAIGITRVTVPSEGFDIDFRFLTPATEGQKEVFAAAAARWEELISGDLPTAQLLTPQFSCVGAVDEWIDDLTIRVILDSIDGPGGVLGSAGPCFVRSGTYLPSLGVMIFDTSDVTLPQFGDVILHEMGHVLGIGTLWDFFGYLQDDNGILDDCFPLGNDPLTTDPFFSGTAAIAAFEGSGGAEYIGNMVPVENEWGEGTRCGHWRESVLETELMTGFVEQAGVVMPLSEITVKSLADMGYTVAASGWDEFSCPQCVLPAPGAVAADIDATDLLLLDDILRLPVYVPGEDGQVVELKSGHPQALPIRQ